MKEKARESTYQKTKPLSEAADKAMKNYEQAIRTGLKLQEEAAHLWTNVLNQSASPHDWQKRFSGATTVANGIIPAAQKRLEICSSKINRCGAKVQPFCLAFRKVCGLANIRGLLEQFGAGLGIFFHQVKNFFEPLLGCGKDSVGNCRST